MRHPNPDMLLRIAQADAYCLATEYIKFPRDKAIYDRALEFRSYVQHPTHSLSAGRYSDDTQMSVAVAEALIAEAGWGGYVDCVAKEWFCVRFWSAFKRDPRDGYSRGFQKLLEESHSPKELAAKLDPNSDKNGAAMRSVPLGVIYDVKEMLDVARAQASVTHATRVGILTSQAVALMSHFALHHEGALDTDMFAWCSKQLPEFREFLGAWSGPVTGPDVGMKTVQAVVTLLEREHSLKGIMRQVIEWGGDTDSVASIAVGIASARIKNDLPDFFEHGLETGRKYGVEFLRNLGESLMSHHPGSCTCK